MVGVPLSFRIGPATVHLYAVGMALAFLFALAYTRRRFSARGLAWEWAGRGFLYIVVGSLVGARAVHVLANLSYYRAHPGDVVALWNGGLSSFGGLLVGIPVGLWFQRHYLPSVAIVTTLDLVAPTLAGAWMVDAVVGRQFMVRAGGHPTDAWYGMHYVGQVGARVPVPLFQALECAGIWLIILWFERRVKPGRGTTFCLFMALWGMARFNDEFWWLARPRLWDAVEITGLVMALVGLIGLYALTRRRPGPSHPLLDARQRSRWARLPTLVTSREAVAGPTRAQLEESRGSLTANTGQPRMP